MARLNHSNTAVRTSLSSAISDTDTSLDVGDATGYPSTPFAIEIGDEVIRVDAKSGTTFSSLQRGYDGTTATSHASGSAVQHAGISEDFEEIWERVIAARKTSDQTKASGTTTIADDDLSITLPGSISGLIDAKLIVSYDESGFKWDWSIPTNASGQHGGGSMSQSSDSNVDAAGPSSLTTAVSLVQGTSNPGPHIVTISGYIDSGDGGALTLNWAKESDTGGSLTVHQGSHIKVLKT